MNKGFTAYYKEGYKAAKNTFKNNGNLLKYYAYVLMSLLSNLLIFTKPITDIMGFRLLKMIKNDENINLLEATELTDNRKIYWTYLVAKSIKALMYIGIILTIALAGGLLFLIGLSLYPISGLSIRPNVFVISVAIVLAIFIIAIPLTSVPVGCVVENNDSIGASKVASYSVNKLKKSGKLTWIIAYILEYLIKIIFIAILVSLAGAMISMLRVEEFTNVGPFFLIALLLSISVILIYLLFCNKVVVALKLLRVMLYEDIVLADKNSNDIKEEDKNEKN